MLTEVKYGGHIQGEVIDFTQHECGNCGIPFFVPTRWLKNKINEHGSFCCPNGCNRKFTGKSDAEKVREELEALKREKERQHELLQNKLLDTINEKNKVEKQLKRIHKGVCPCCNRSFQNLANHIKTQHPEMIGNDKYIHKKAKPPIK